MHNSENCGPAPATTGPGTKEKREEKKKEKREEKKKKKEKKREEREEDKIDRVRVNVYT